MDEIFKEKSVHGESWSSVHGGYFSNPVYASLLTGDICRRVSERRPGILSDVGGGTGFLLSMIRDALGGYCPPLLDIDVSDEQLMIAARLGMSTLKCSALELSRVDITGHGQPPVMLAMRSVAHYFGADWPLLFKHLRSILEKGECLVHQTACFNGKEAAACVDRIYSLLGTGKIFPTECGLVEELSCSGWRVDIVGSPNPIVIKSDELATRYSKTTAELADIRDIVNNEFGQAPGVFEIEGDGFRTKLDYVVMCCEAV